jgi:nicotinamide mononucleotide adenylyltransferase
MFARVGLFEEMGEEGEEKRMIEHEHLKYTASVQKMA